MRKRRLLVLLFGAVAVLAVGLLATVENLPAQPEKGDAALGKGKRAQEFVAAFNRGDAKAIAGFYTPDADYIDQVGGQVKGRAALEKLYAKTFAENKGAKLNITVLSARLLSPDVGLEDGITEVNPADGGPPTLARFSAILVKKGGEWYIESVRDSVAYPPSNAEHFADLEWLLGDWAGEAEKGESSRASYTWAENRNFIVSTFATTLNGIPVVGGTQWIGWDAIDKKIRSWSFYSGGGIGEAVWSHESGKWFIKTKAKTADGKRISATNVVTKVDIDHATWQMTQLNVDGKMIADPPPQKLKRVMPQ
jgi:uncharacterized protein (TIGR02246 family)